MNTGFEFNQSVNSAEFLPLAAKMRPVTVDQYFGQQHIIGPNTPLRNALLRKQCHSMILWGPPGTGKTTLAELVALHCDAHIERLSAKRLSQQSIIKNKVSAPYYLLMRCIVLIKASKMRFYPILKTVQ